MSQEPKIFFIQENEILLRVSVERYDSTLQKYKDSGKEYVVKRYDDIRFLVIW